MSFEKVQEALKGTELEQKLIQLEQSSATVELAAKALHTEPDRIAKTLSFFVSGEPILIVVAGEARIDNRKYKDYFHEKARMIPFDEVEEHVGHVPGGVCPFAVPDSVSIYLDVSLKQYDVVYPAAGSGNTAVSATIEELEKYTGYRAWIDVCREKER